MKTPAPFDETKTEAGLPAPTGSASRGLKRCGLLAVIVIGIALGYMGLRSVWFALTGGPPKEPSAFDVAFLFVCQWLLLVIGCAAIWGWLENKLKRK